MASGKILIIGGTGGVASCVIKQLLQLSPLPSLRVSSRTPSKLPSFPSQVEVVKADVSDPSTYPSLFNNVSKMFLYIHGLENTLGAFLTAAKESGVEHIVFNSSFAALTPEHPMGRAHANIENAIRDAGFAYTFLRGKGYCTNVYQTWAPLIKTQSFVSLPHPLSHSVLIADEDTASVAVAAFSSSLSSPLSSLLLNQAPVLSGPESLTNRQILDILSQVREEKRGKKIEVRETSDEQWKKEVLGSGYFSFPPSVLDAMIKNWKTTDNVPQEINPEVKKITGKNTTFLEWARLHADKLFD